MIRQYEIMLQPLDEARRITASHAYRCYGWLMDQVPEKYGDKLHNDGFTPISQCLITDRKNQRIIWKVSLLNDEAIQILDGCLTSLSAMEIDEMKIKAALQKVKSISELSELADANDSVDVQRISIDFISPTSFKINGRYAIFPDTDHIVSSIVQQWEHVFPESTISDKDAIEMLKKSLLISDYRLRGSRFYMKNSCIHGFAGKIIVSSHLAGPMQEIWRMMLSLAEYTGIGIKTALGMGGVRVFS